MGKLILIFLGLLTGAIALTSPENTTAALAQWGLTIPQVLMTLGTVGLFWIVRQIRKG